MSTEKIQPADPGARRKSLWLIGIATIIGAGLILAFEFFREDIQQWLERNIDYLLENSIIVFFFSLALIAPILVGETYLLLLGNRTVRAKRFPPPGYAVVRNTPILEGARGLRRGRIIQALSLLLLFSTAAIPFVLWYIFRALAEST